MQQTINERLKILIDALKISARAFSAQLQVPESNTRNYLDKNTKLNSDYLERIAIHFKSVNLSWLITGQGELFLADANTAVESNNNYTKKNSGNAIGTNHGVAAQSQGQALSTDLTVQLEAAQQLIQQLRSQLKDKELIIELLQKNK